MTTTQSLHDPSLSQLVSQLAEQTGRLVRDELRLAQLELGAKGKKAGIGAGLFGGAGLLSAYGIGCLVTAAVLALALVLPGWAAALAVAGALFVIAGVAALIGARQVKKAVPPVPHEALASMKLDVAALKR